MTIIRRGDIDDLKQVQDLAIQEWSRFKEELTPDNWMQLHQSLANEKTYIELFQLAECFVCENDKEEIIGFGFLVPSGNPTETYNEQQSYLRFVTVSVKYSGQQIGQRLTEACIARAKENSEKLIALHTSEMMHAARHIYEKLGFTVIRELEPRLGKRYWLYQLEL